MKINRRDLRRLIESLVNDRSVTQIKENKIKNFFRKLGDRRSAKILQKMADKENQRVVSDMLGQKVKKVTFSYPEQQVAGDPDPDLPTLNFPEEEIAGNPQDAIMNDLRATYDFRLGNTMQDAQINYRHHPHI